MAEGRPEVCSTGVEGAEACVSVSLGQLMANATVGTKLLKRPQAPAARGNAQL